MPTPLAESLAQLRVGNQKSLIDFYQRSRHLFARWAQRQHRLPPEQAHGLLQDTLLDFYDQVADGRVTKMPDDVRAYIYGMAQQRLAAAVPAHVPLPAAEASRRQQLLTHFNQLGPDCQQVFTYFYFNGYNLAKLGGKMGYPNPTVARLQKNSCLRKLVELARPPAVLRQHLDALESFADGHLLAAEQEAFELRLEQDETLADAHAAYEQLTADLRWAAGHDALRLRLQALDARMNERGTALARAETLGQQRQRRGLVWGTVGVLLLVVAGWAAWYFSRPSPARPARSWDAYYQPDPGPVVTTGLLHSRPLLAEALDQYQSGHYPAALHSLGRVSPASVGADTLLYLRGLILLREGQGEAAQLYFRRVGTEDSTGELARRARYHLGMAYWQAQKTAPALTALRAVAADSLNPYRASARRAVVAGVLDGQ
ncbi:RNA polymerase sigma factor [Hymenobacter negativus]|uniref:Sigma-70 family RNA polymerase sigma factor n=1 Tax=Hymenobacter negativus TaxID=2795026 RepID=A0ABS3QB00_9BACT|nr:sigma-70 family RNA polymerase sigma factor [Hymenobacter negativus]MBO2008286.1 sigma-70 family RNA polymerase sigma factor [Hymenobacter negativus]